MQPIRSAANLFATVFACLVTAATLAGAAGECSQPVSSGTKPVATDCLFILGAAVGLQTCEPQCICAPKGTMAVSATDALVCLNASVGVPVELDCPCAPVLDCDQAGIPCSFADVPLAIIERSLVLSEQVADQLDEGASAEDVAAFLSSQDDMADVTADGPVISFRLDGGRPMIVDFADDQEFLPIETESALFAPAPTFELPEVVAGEGPQKHALVLSPFRYEPHFGDSGEQVAAFLSTIRGYAGNVTYFATIDELDPQVTVDTLTQLDDYDVVHIDTHGGTICKKKELGGLAARAKSKDKDKCENGITDFLVQRFHGTADDLLSLAHPGVIHYRGRLYQSIAVTADFFRHYYPQGLTNTLFILGSCNTFRPDMAEAIAGNRGVYMSWDGYTDYGLVKNSSLALLDYLKDGLTVGEAHERLPEFSSGNPDAAGSRFVYTQRYFGGDVRIRDLITVRDNLTGEVVTDTSGIEVVGIPGDGENDHLDLEFTVDGITPDSLGGFFVNLMINDHVIGHLNLEMSGIQIGEFRYQVSTPVPLPFDVQEGQALNMDFWIPLPDLGANHYVASPKVNERGDPEVGSEYRLTSTTRTNRVDDSTIKSATVTFVLDPDQNPDSAYRWFSAKEGTLHVERDYEDTLGCRFNVSHTIDIPEGAANTYLKFDRTGTTILLDGFGNAPNESVETTGSCGEKATVSVGGVYFLADDVPVHGSSIQGTYNDGSAFPTIIDWTLSKVR
jgi:hypothetical protein